MQVETHFYGVFNQSGQHSSRGVSAKLNKLFPQKNSKITVHVFLAKKKDARIVALTPVMWG